MTVIDKRGRRSIVRSFFIISVALVASAVALPYYSRSMASAPHSGESVAVWLTTNDGLNQLTPQSAITFAPDDAFNPLTIDVNENQTYQQMDGFGGALTDSSAWLIAHSPYSTTIMNKLFSAQVGIGISMLRQPIAASDFTIGNVPYSYDDMPPGQSDPSLTNFSIAHDRSYIIPLLQQALQVNPSLKIMANPWSPPGWMKTSGSMIDSSTQGRLLSTSYAPLAAYFVKFIQAYQALGVPIYAITPQNEPGFDAPNYPGMQMSSGEEANLIKNYLAPALTAATLSPKILNYDWIFGFDPTASSLPFPQQIMQDPATAAVVAGSAYHCYGGNPNTMTEVHDVYPQKDLYETECFDLVNRPNTPIEEVINAVRNWSKTALMWNVALEPNGGPRQGLDCTGCLGFVTIDPTNPLSVTYTRDYYQIGHASKFVVSGAYRIASNSFGSGWYYNQNPLPNQWWYPSTVIEDVAFKNPDGSKVLIAFNRANTPQTFKVRWGAESFTYTLPSAAIVTFVWSGEQQSGSITPAPGPEYYALNAGDQPAGSFTADTYFDKGYGITVSTPIITNGVIDPAPMNVYQSQRLSPQGFQYVFPALTPGARYGVRLHFAELENMVSGQRQFTINVNGVLIASNFDIYAAAGGVQNKAVILQTLATADTTGTITVAFMPGAAGSPACNGIEIVDPATLPPLPTPTDTQTPLPTASGTPIPTFTPAPTMSSAASATGTATPIATTIATATPSALATGVASVVAIMSATGTAMPGVTASVAATTMPIAPTTTSRPLVPLPSGAESSLPLSLSSLPMHVIGGDTLAVTVHTAAYAHIDATLDIAQTQMNRSASALAEKLKHYNAILPYYTQVSTSANAYGKAVLRLVVTYQPLGKVKAALHVVAHWGSQVAQRTTNIMVQPLEADLTLNAVGLTLRSKPQVYVRGRVHLILTQSARYKKVVDMLLHGETNRHGVLVIALKALHHLPSNVSMRAQITMTVRNGALVVSWHKTVDRFAVWMSR